MVAVMLITISTLECYFLQIMVMYKLGALIEIAFY